MPKIAVLLMILEQPQVYRRLPFTTHFCTTSLLWVPSFSKLGIFGEYFYQPTSSNVIFVRAVHHLFHRWAIPPFVGGSHASRPYAHHCRQKKLGFLSAHLASLSYSGLGHPSSSLVCFGVACLPLRLLVWSLRLLCSWLPLRNFTFPHCGCAEKFRGAHNVSRCSLRDYFLRCSTYVIVVVYIVCLFVGEALYLRFRISIYLFCDGHVRSYY